MKKTLLAMTQNILGEMGSDEVNGIDDTVESQQVAAVIRSTYEYMMDNKTWDHLKKMFQLDSSADLNKPTYLKSPEKLRELIFFNYNKTKQSDTTIKYDMVHYKHPDEFLRLTSGRNTGNDNVLIVTDFSGIQLFIINDQPPTYWTSFDDQYIVCDSYDSAVDSTLQTSKTQCYGMFDPTWVHLDNAVPDLPSEAFSTLENEAKSTAFFTIKQMANQKAEQQSRKGQSWLSRNAWANHGGVRYDDYGRRGRK